MNDVAERVAPVEVHQFAGIAYVLPLYEGRPSFAKKVGPFGVGANLRLSCFGIGIELLKAGAIVTLGPLSIWVAHIKRQSDAFDAALADASPDIGKEG